MLLALALQPACTNNSVMTLLLFMNCDLHVHLYWYVALPEALEAAGLVAELDCLICVFACFVFVGCCHVLPGLLGPYISPARLCAYVDERHALYASVTTTQHGSMLSVLALSNEVSIAGERAYCAHALPAWYSTCPCLHQT